MFLIIPLLVLSLPIFAGFQNARGMNKLSPGVWEVTCNAGNRERKTPQEISNGEFCQGFQEESQCLQTAQRLLPSIQRDDPEERKELIDACAHGTPETFKCVKRTAERLESRHRDERVEVINIINKCSKSPVGIEDCLEFGFRRTRKNDPESVFKLLDACAGSTESTPLCLEESSRNLIANEIDSVEEVEELITACKPAHIEIDVCLREAKRNALSELEYNERKEITAFIKSCL